MKWEPQYTLCSFPNMTVIRKGKKAVCEISINVYDSESNFQVALHLSGNEVETIEIDLDSFEVRRSQVDVPTLFLLKQVLGVRLIQNAEEICSIVMKEDQIDIFKKATLISPLPTSQFSLIVLDAPYTERYVRCGERTGANHPLLLDRL